MSEKQYKLNLHEITVTAKKPKHKAPNIFKEDWDSLFGKKRVSGVNRAWKRNPKYMQGLQDVNNTIGAVASLPIVGMAYNIPLLAGAMNLTGAYEGIKNTFSSEGVAKTYNLFKKGEYLKALKSAGGDILNLSLTLPVLSKLRELSPFAKKGVEEVTRQAAKHSKVVRDKVIAHELNKAADNFTPVVSENYFNSPNNWYRIVSLPEIGTLKELGHNVTSRDAADFPSISNDFREFVIENDLTPGRGKNEGYWVKNPKKQFALFLKTGSAHGNKSQGAKGKVWTGGTSTGKQFLEYILEGEAPPLIHTGVGNNRSRFELVPWENVETGARIGFNTGEMPMNNLRMFRRLPDGSYLYEGVVLPNKTIQYTPKENPIKVAIVLPRKSKISDAEKAGIPKGERNQVKKDKANPAIEFEKQYGERPSVGGYPTTIEEIIPNEFPTQALQEPWFKYNAVGNSLFFQSPQKAEYINNLKKYISTLPKVYSNKTDPFTIRDYRSFLDRNGINPYILSDEEISTLLHSQYDQLTSQMSGKLKGVVMFHGGYKPIERFNFLQDIGKGLLNRGAQGAGNYFITGRHNYGQIHIYDVNTNEDLMLGDMLPYLINNVKSTPLGATLLIKGIVPKYQQPPDGFISTIAKLGDLFKIGYKDYTMAERTKLIEKLKNDINEYINSKEYQEYLKNTIIPKESNMFIIDTDALGRDISLGKTVYPVRNGQNIKSIEGVIPRNSGIKSLFPHPSTLLLDANGNWFINRNWDDIRINYKQGGKIK